MNRTPELEMRGISKSFPGVCALDEASLEAHAGEVHVLLGENGAGKSTLMKILTGVYPRDAGEILIGGRPVEIANPHQALDLGISMVYQEASLAGQLSVAENIFLGREPLKNASLGIIDRRKMVRDTAAILETLELEIAPVTPVRRRNGRPALNDESAEACAALI